MIDTEFISSLDCLSVPIHSGSLTYSLSIEGFKYKVWVLMVVSTVLHAGRLEMFSIGGWLANFCAYFLDM